MNKVKGPLKVDIKVYKQITHIMWCVYSVCDITDQTFKSERNDHKTSLLRFVNKLHVLYRGFIQYVRLPIKHQKVKRMTKQLRI